MKIRETNKSDIVWIREIFRREWLGDFVVSRGKRHFPENLLGLTIEERGKKLGLLTYRLIGKEIEITTLNSFKENQGIGTALIKHLIKLAKKMALKEYG